MFCAAYLLQLIFHSLLCTVCSLTRLAPSFQPFFYLSRKGCARVAKHRRARPLQFCGMKRLSQRFTPNRANIGRQTRRSSRGGGYVVREGSRKARGERNTLLWCGAARTVSPAALSQPAQIACACSTTCVQLASPIRQARQHSHSRRTPSTAVSPDDLA